MSGKSIYDVVWKPPKSIDPRAKWQKIGVIVEYSDVTLKFHLNSYIPMSYIIFCANHPNASWCMIYKRRVKDSDIRQPHEGEEGWDDDSGDGY